MEDIDGSLSTTLSVYRGTPDRLEMVRAKLQLILMKMEKCCGIYRIGLSQLVEQWLHLTTRTFLTVMLVALKIVSVALYGWR